MARYESRARFEARKRAEEANLRLASLMRKMESGDIPSAIVDGRRVPVLDVQDHEAVGVRFRVTTGPISAWRLAAEVSDPRGDVSVRSRVRMGADGRWMKEDLR